MFVAGAQLSASGIALLARRLQEAGDLELAQTIGLALDAGQEELLIGPAEGHAVLAVLHDCPPELRPLRDALQARA